MTESQQGRLTRESKGLAMLPRLVIATLTFLTLALGCSAEENHADHEELRSLLSGATKAVNEQRFDSLSEFFHPKLRVTTVNQDTIIKPEALEPFFRSWVGEGQYVNSMSMSMEADELTEFYGEGESRFGVARGQGKEDYKLADGRHLKLDTRWTATCTKDEQGKWKILALHIGANFYDNPIVHQFQKAAKTYPPIAGILGLLIGLVIGYFGGRKRS